MSVMSRISCGRGFQTVDPATETTLVWVGGTVYLRVSAGERMSLSTRCFKCGKKNPSKIVVSSVDEKQNLRKLQEISYARRCTMDICAVQ